MAKTIFRSLLLLLVIILTLFFVHLRKQMTTHRSSVRTIARLDISTLESALEQYKNIGGQYPSQEQGLQALLQRPVSQPLPKDWVQAVNNADAFLDPWGTLYHYQYSGTGIFEKPKLISAGPDKKFGTKDDLSNQHEVR